MNVPVLSNVHKSLLQNNFDVDFIKQSAEISVCFFLLPGTFQNIECVLLKTSVIKLFTFYKIGGSTWYMFVCALQRDHLETAPPFTVPCHGCEAL